MNGENERKFLKFLHPFGRRARVEQRAISKEKWIFFPSWTRSSFFARDSTDWEPAAIEKRNPRIRSNNFDCWVQRRYMTRIEGGGAGGEIMPLESEEKILLL